MLVMVARPLAPCLLCSLTDQQCL